MRLSHGTSSEEETVLFLSPSDTPQHIVPLFHIYIFEAFYARMFAWREDKFSNANMSALPDHHHAHL